MMSTRAFLKLPPCRRGDSISADNAPPGLKSDAPYTLVFQSTATTALFGVAMNCLRLQNTSTYLRGEKFDRLFS